MTSLLLRCAVCDGTPKVLCKCGLCGALCCEPHCVQRLVRFAGSIAAIIRCPSCSNIEASLRDHGAPLTREQEEEELRVGRDGLPITPDDERELDDAFDSDDPFLPEEDDDEDDGPHQPWTPAQRHEAIMRGDYEPPRDNR